MNSPKKYFYSIHLSSNWRLAANILSLWLRYFIENKRFHDQFICNLWLWLRISLFSDGFCYSLIVLLYLFVIHSKRKRINYNQYQRCKKRQLRFIISLFRHCFLSLNEKCWFQSISQIQVYLVCASFSLLHGLIFNSLSVPYSKKIYIYIFHLYQTW